MNLLPPLRLIEDLMFFSTTVAFILLTGGLFIGIISIDNIFEQHLTHKIFFSMLAWLIFLFLLIGRIKYQLRGRKGSLFNDRWFYSSCYGFFWFKICSRNFIREKLNDYLRPNASGHNSYYSYFSLSLFFELRNRHDGFKSLSTQTSGDRKK